MYVYIVYICIGLCTTKEIYLLQRNLEQFLLFYCQVFYSNIYIFLLYLY